MSLYQQGQGSRQSMSHCVLLLLALFVHDGSVGDLSNEIVSVMSMGLVDYDILS